MNVGELIRFNESLYLPFLYIRLNEILYLPSVLMFYFVESSVRGSEQSECPCNVWTDLYCVYLVICKLMKVVVENLLMKYDDLFMTRWDQYTINFLSNA